MGYHLTTSDDAKPATKYTCVHRKLHRGPIFDRGVMGSALEIANKVDGGSEGQGTSHVYSEGIWGTLSQSTELGGYVAGLDIECEEGKER